jgi:hypothetical protein
MTQQLAYAATYTNPSISVIVDSLQRLSAEQLTDVLQFVHFLQYRPLLIDETSDDESLWVAVRANEAFDENHPQQSPMRFETGEEFLRSTADW